MAQRETHVGNNGAVSTGEVLAPFHSVFIVSTPDEKQRRLLNSNEEEPGRQNEDELELEKFCEVDMDVEIKEEEELTWKRRVRGGRKPGKAKKNKRNAEVSDPENLASPQDPLQTPQHSEDEEGRVGGGGDWPAAAAAAAADVPVTDFLLLESSEARLQWGKREYLDEEDTTWHPGRCRSGAAGGRRAGGFGGKGGRMRRTVSLSRRTEQKLAGWLKANTWIYDKSRDKFRETKHKYLEFEKAAKEVNLSSGELIQWFKGVRTRIGRKKFSMPEQLTERETFLKKNFGFLEAYIVRQNRSSKKDAAETTPAAPPPAPAAPVPSDYDDTSVHSAGVGPAGPSHYTSVHSAGVSPAGASHHKGKDEGPSRQSPEPPPPRSPTPPPPETPREGKGSLAWIADLLRDGVNTREQLAAVQQSQTQHEKLVAGYVGYLQPLLLEIPKSRWKAFTLENIALINSFTEPLPPPAAQPARPPYTPPPAQWLPPHNPFQPPQSPQNPFQPPQPLQPPHTQ